MLVLNIINYIKHIFFNFHFVFDNFLHLITTGIKRRNKGIAEYVQHLCLKRNSSVIELNLSPNAPAYNAVCSFLLHANEAGN